MLFNSLEFLVFLPIVVALAAALRGHARTRNAVLLLASYLFYGWWDWRFLSLIAVSTLVDFVVGARLAATDGARGRKALLAVSLVVNLGLLGFFKYWNFFVDGAADLLHLLGADVPTPVLEVVLPVGVSFYTFQTLSYTIDIYRRRLEPTRSLLTFALFVAFFPQLVAGPIERASHLLGQLSVSRKPTPIEVESGAWLILQGYFKKVVVADNLAPIVEQVYRQGQLPMSADVWFATFAFALQIYADFSGYSDIARGVARWFGVDLMLNFDAPYFSRNVREFWRRWHISLSTWLRDYLYVPLGGNRLGAGRTYVNLMITMVLGGLWHGAGWNWVAWGAWHGAFLSLHRLASGRWLRQTRASGVVTVGSWFATMLVVLYSWLLFRAEGMGHAWALTRAALGLAEGYTVLDLGSLAVIAAVAVPLVALDAWQVRTRCVAPATQLSPVGRLAVFAALLFAVVAFGSFRGTYFIYFQF